MAFKSNTNGSSLPDISMAYVRLLGGRSRPAEYLRHPRILKNFLFLLQLFHILIISSLSTYSAHGMFLLLPYELVMKKTEQVELSARVEGLA